MPSLDELFERFPEMRPVHKPPSLFTLNGCGTRVYGRRDHDAETGTYVLTQWFTLLYIPIIPLAAYRVANAANGGWYFLGRVPLSGAAKGWAACLMLIVAGVAGWIAWDNHVKSPGYKERQLLEEGDRQRDRGQLAEAARTYRAVAEGPSEHAATAVKSVAALLDSPGPQDKAAPAEMAGVYRVAYELRDRPGALKEKQLFERGLRLAQARGDDDPQGALAVLEAVEEAAPAPEAVLPAKQKLLERVAADHPDDVAALSKLAVVYERSNQSDRCLPLLEPHAKDLGTTEGARILGLIYVAANKDDEAYALLQPYADAHLKELGDAESGFDSAEKLAAQRVIDELKKHAASDFDYAGYEKANEARRQQMVDDHVMGRLKNDPDLRRRREALARAAVVVPVVLDLGSLQVERAQHLNDPAARKAELERAEKTYLSVRTLAGHRTEYRLSLGQVYYWLGKPAEGRKLFDEALTADGRKFESLLVVARLLRELGAAAESRPLSEEAYKQAGTDAAKKQQAALLRALTHTDLDDELLWLERCEPTSPEARASLAEVRGEKAERDGKDAEAANQFREAAKVYAALPESEMTLNNGGLAQLHLFRVTGDRDALDQGVRMLEKALALRPDDGILAGNVASILLGIGLRDVVGDRIDLKRLKRDAGLDLCSFLYADPAGKEALVRRARESAAFAKARAQLDRALLLAPNNAALYQLSQQLLEFLGDRDGMARLARRAEEARPDVEAQKQETLDYYQGKDDDKHRREGAAAVARAERILKEARGAGGATFAAAAQSLVRARLSQEVLGDAPDADELVRLAEEAHKAAPSVATSGALEAALLARASRALAKGEPEYAAMEKRSRRSLGSTYLVAVALWREGKPRGAALANDDVKHAVELVKAQAAAFPDDPGEWQWAMLRAAHPQEAARAAEALKKDDKGRHDRGLEARLTPASAATAFRLCWALDSAGQAQEALDALRRCAAEGVPMPFDVK
jgi:tetratricopeptide (TPR) repeat protein